MNRILTWHYEGIKAPGKRVGAAYYIEADYVPYAVRIQAGTAPNMEDAEFEILKDGVSIMNKRDSIQYDTYGRITSDAQTTTVALTKGETSAEAADDFKRETVESGCWLTCTLTKDGGGENFTIQCELSPVDDENESEE